jgi:hypothetical protein
MHIDPVFADPLQLSTALAAICFASTYVLCEDGIRVLDGSTVDFKLFEELLLL